jgi:hypothetical protein
MKKRILISAAVGLLVTTPAMAQKAGAAKTGSELLGSLAKGTGGQLGQIVGGAVLTSVLTDLGLFSAIGLGGNSDAEVEAKLDQIINELQTMKADIGDLQQDVVNLDSTLQAGDDRALFDSKVSDMTTAQTHILNCAADIKQAATNPGSDTTDTDLQQFAQQIVGAASSTTSDCITLMDDFATIDANIVGSTGLGNSNEGAYTLLARLLKETGSTQFEPIASHFIQFQITQHQALALVRSAYTALGRPDALQDALTTPPHNLLNRLRDEEVAFLNATDAFVTTGAPNTYDPSVAALADAIVQRLESVHGQASTYTLSILDTATDFVPTVHQASQANLTLSDTIQGAMSSYYDMSDDQLTAGITSCRNSSPTDGFSYLRPYGGSGAGFKLGSSCKVHIERHLQQNVNLPPGSSWGARGRYYGSGTADQALTIQRRNAATLAQEADADAFALAGDPEGASSDASAFTVVPDDTDPTHVTLTIDLPGLPGTPVRTSQSHPFAAAGSGAVASFTRVPSGPDFPDRYALAMNGKYLAVDDSGFASLADTPTYFDFRATPDGHTELDYTGGVLYVDNQYSQAFFYEAPDTYLANTVNIANGFLVTLWNVPNDGIPRAAPQTSLSAYPPCLDGSGNPQLAYENLGFGTYLPTTECSDSGLTYVIYDATFHNDDSFDRRFQFKLGAQVSLPSGVSAGLAGLHCYVPGSGSPDDHLDVAAVSVDTNTPTAALTPTTFDPINWNLTVPSHGSLTLQCQILDDLGAAAAFDINEFDVSPCVAPDTGNCKVYPQ